MTLFGIPLGGWLLIGVGIFAVVMMVAVHYYGAHGHSGEEDEH